MNMRRISGGLCLAAVAAVLAVCGIAMAEGPTSLPAADSMVQRRCQLAYVLLWNKDYAGAEQEFRKAIAGEPKYDEARIGLALALERKGDLKAAAEEFDRIDSKSSQIQAANAGRARILTSQRKFDRAIELYEAIKKANALTDEYRLKYVETLGLAGQADKALAELAPLRSDAKLASDVAKLEGLVLFWSGRSKEAIPKMREALTKSPEDIDLRIDLAQALVQAQDYAAALDILDKLPAEVAGTAKPVVLRSDIMVAQKQYDEAIALISGVLKKDPKADQLKVRLAELLSWVQKYDEAIKVYRDYLGAHADDHQARTKLAETLTWAGKFEEAAKEYRIALGESEK